VSQHLVIEHHDDVVVVRIARPEKRNAINRALLHDLPEVLASHSARASAMVLTGGDSVFSAGFDLSELGNGLADLQIDDEISTAAQAIRDLPIPVVAAIEGACVGAAVELALACDVRVLSQTAFFAIPAARLGILYRPDGIASLVATVGRETAMRLLVIGERISAESAVASRLAGFCVPAGTAVTYSIALAGHTSGSVAAALTATKQLIIEASATSVDVSGFEQLRRELLVSEARKSAVSNAQESPRRKDRK
jgi:enoyl-CoA hydratase/carnithine racemase